MSSSDTPNATPEPSVAPGTPKEALTSRASHTPHATTTVHYGIAPPTTHSGAALGGLGTHGSADGGLRQRHLVDGVVHGGGVGGDDVNFDPVGPRPHLLCTRALYKLFKPFRASPRVAYMS